MAHRLHVALEGRGYDLVVEPGVLDSAGRLIAQAVGPRRVIVVTDTNLARTPHPLRLSRALTAGGLVHEMLTVPPGETTKSMAELGGLCEAVLARGIDRRTVILALGGGVVGDLAGMAAAVLLRGLDLVQVPTTLLAQVDSSTGGKTGVNSAHGKNLIGAFHQPRLVLIDPTVLASLPGRELRCGYAELVKHAFIADADLFAWLETEAPRLIDGDLDTLAEGIARSVAVKARIVAEDERETTGRRALLNFGHTFAHAYETLAGYGEALPHGEAVAIGMADAFALSVVLGSCSGQEAGRAIAHLRRCGLPVTLAERGLGFRSDAVVGVMRKDKKALDGRLAFVVSEGLGKARLRADVEEALLPGVLGRHDPDERSGDGARELEA